MSSGLGRRLEEREQCSILLFVLSSVFVKACSARRVQPASYI